VSVLDLLDNVRLHPQNALRRRMNLLYDFNRVPRPQQTLSGLETEPLIHDPCLVEPDGIEPTTSCLQSTRSPN
jgi:hypothetical protein